MKKTTTLILLIFIFAAFTNAQNVITRPTKPAQLMPKSLKQIPAKGNKVAIKRCSTADAYANRMANDPVYKAQRDASELKIENWIANHPKYKSKSIVTIPVVVHVIYNAVAEKLSDSRVFEQLKATNTDWAGNSTHSMNAFADSLKANTGVQFCLATIDPSGNSTTGIDYKQTTVISFNITGSAASCSGYPERCSSTGGSDAWDVTKYLNIWVCNAGNLCGISEYPPIIINNYYGTTINYMFFGHTGASAPYNLGGALSHELGHCFNLFHIWGDDNGTCTGTDYCNDTPNQANCYFGSHESGNL